MTMQVGMVGTDGILVASDTQWTDNKAVVRASFNATKFKIEPMCGVAVSRSGALRTAGYLADELISLTLQNENWVVDDFEAIARICQRLFERVEPGREDAQCLVAFTRPTLKLCLFRTAKLKSGEWTVVGHTVDGIAYAGDTANPAVFWGTSYYMPTTIERLTFLAAHLVLSAGALNPAGISGLDIVLCTESGISQLDIKAIRELEVRSTVLDKYIVGSLFSSHQM